VNKARELEVPMVTEQFIVQSVLAQSVLPAGKFLVENNEEEGGADDGGDEDGEDHDDDDNDEEEKREKLRQPPYTREYFGRLYDEVVMTKPPDWYKDAEKWGFVVKQWFRGAPVDSYWALMGTSIRFQSLHTSHHILILLDSRCEAYCFPSRWC